MRKEYDFRASWYSVPKSDQSLPARLRCTKPKIRSALEVMRQAQAGQTFEISVEPIGLCTRL
jgi:hypothetical protein